MFSRDQNSLKGNNFNLFSHTSIVLILNSSTGKDLRNICKFENSHICIYILRFGRCAGGLVRREVAIGFMLFLPCFGLTNCSSGGRVFVGAVSSGFSCALVMRVPAD